MWQLKHSHSNGLGVGYLYWHLPTCACENMLICKSLWVKLKKFSVRYMIQLLRTGSMAFVIHYGDSLQSLMMTPSLSAIINYLSTFKVLREPSSLRARDWVPLLPCTISHGAPPHWLEFSYRKRKGWSVNSWRSHHPQIQSNNPSFVRNVFVSQEHVSSRQWPAWVAAVFKAL